jgi:acetyl/propionyl-CoA carboxylase alpha subunit
MKVLVANRGEIACRIFKTLRQEGMRSVAIYADDEKQAEHVFMADEALALKGERPYLDAEQIIELALEHQVEAIHPGYGYLSENANFADASKQAGIQFIGPDGQAMRLLGDKSKARALAQSLDIPVVPGAEACQNIEEAQSLAQSLSYPLLLKAAAGGGGKGMRLVEDASTLSQSFRAAQHEARNAFGDDQILLEKWIHPARHIEVQILSDGENVITLGERECSLQRRYQKIVEESPAPGANDDLRSQLYAAAKKIIKAADYKNAGTVEFLVGPNNTFYFLEVNTRLQVEHPVSEFCFGVDLVAWQLAIAQGDKINIEPTSRGHALEVRLNAEAPYEGFLPQSGDLAVLEWPQHPFVRIDTGMREGNHIGSQYDPLLAKMIAWGETRKQATQRLIAALKDTTILGVQTNQTFLLQILEEQFFTDGQTFTTTIENLDWHPPAGDENILAQVGTHHYNHAQKSTQRAVPAPFSRLKGFRLGS